MGYVNIFSNPYTSTESWSAQGAILRYGVEQGSIDWNWSAEEQNRPVCSVDPTGEPCPLIISGINLTYTRQSQQIYPLNATESGQATKITIKGAPQGVLQLTSIYSPVAESIACFLKLASRDCVPKDNEMWITLRPFGSITCTTKEGSRNVDAKDAAKITWRISGVELNQLGLQMQSGPTTIVSMPLNFEFTNLLISDDGNFGGQLRGSVR